EDGIRDRNVTGVQTCALPISQADRHRLIDLTADSPVWAEATAEFSRSFDSPAALIAGLRSIGPVSVDVSAMPQLSAGEAQLVDRSEEHTSELQSRFDLVCRLL